MEEKRYRIEVFEINPITDEEEKVLTHFCFSDDWTISDGNLAIMNKVLLDELEEKVVEKEREFGNCEYCGEPDCVDKICDCCFDALRHGYDPITGEVNE